MTKQQVFAVLMLVLGCLLLSPWRPWGAEVSENRDGSWLRIEPQLIEQRLGVLGRIEATRQVTVAAPFTGLLQALPIAPGQQVAAGNIIAVLDTAELDPQVRQAEAQLLQSQRALRQLQTWASSSEMAQAKRAQAMAGSSLELAQVALKQTQRLFDRGIVARQEVETLQQQMMMLQQDLLAARQHLRQTRERGHGVDLRLASIELDTAQARQRELAALRNQREVRAPFSGLLVPRPSEDRQLALQVGQLANQGTPLFVLVDLSQLQVRAALEQSDLHKVHVGMFVQVSGEGFAGHMLNGRVVAVGQQAKTEEGQGAWFDLLIALETQPDPIALGVRLGMSAQVTVLLHRNEKGVAVPAAALRTDDAGGHYVLYRANDYQPGRKVTVTPVGAVPQGVEVRGLETGSVWVQ
ncbi:efflux RND transporter periplasmic adaptor subunit [Pseudomonas shirazensis]|uniref:efflux RND transporter periplasmic adaptor subunit n=1 Tax=Pseudomonas shirazensis TaxID=2745494 RepID=UPI003D2D4B09